MENKGKLADEVISEVDLLELLNVEQHTLDRLRREKGFPFIRLDAKNRVYLVEEVVAWLKKQQRVS